MVTELNVKLPFKTLKKKTMKTTEIHPTSDVLPEASRSSLQQQVKETEIQSLEDYLSTITVVFIGVFKHFSACAPHSFISALKSFWGPL